jgi:hypothetical protein
VEIGEGRRLADVILEMRNSPERRLENGQNARRVLETLFSRESAVAAWSEVMLRFDRPTGLPSKSSVYEPAE